MYTAGVADIGIAGKDTLMKGFPLYEIAGFEMRKMQGVCAGYPKQKERITSNITRVATKYPGLLK